MRIPTFLRELSLRGSAGALGKSDFADIGCDSQGRQRTFYLITFIILPLLLSARLVAQCYWPVGGGLDVAGYQIGRDFLNVWAGPRIAFGAHPEWLLDLSAYHSEIGRLFGAPLEFHNWSYPLNALVWYWPFSLLPYFPSLAVWTISGLAAYLAVALGIVPPGRRGAALLLLVAAPATWMNGLGGQNGFFTAALFIAAILCLETRPVLAGVMLGVLAFKPQLLLALPLALVALAAWRTVISATLVAAGSVALSVALVGTGPWVTYLGETRRFQLFALQVTPFSDFYAMLMSSVLGAGRAAGLAYGPAMALQMLVAAPVFVAAAWAVTRTRDARLRAFVLVAATPLISPYVMNYDLTALAVVLTWYLTGSLPVTRRWGLFVFLAWLTPITVIYTQRLGIPVAPFVHASIFAIAIHEAARNGQPSLGWSGWLERSRREWQALLSATAAAGGRSAEIWSRMRCALVIAVPRQAGMSTPDRSRD